MLFNRISEHNLTHNAYLIGCQESREAIVVDPQPDIDRYLAAADEMNMKIVAATETHIHADYLSGLRELAEGGVRILVSDEGDRDWKYEWVAGSAYDQRLLKDGDRFRVGRVRFEVKHTPGHTPEHVSFLVIDGEESFDRPMGILSGDFVFVGDVGRPDLLETAAGQAGAMKPAARELYRSLSVFKELPKYLQVWPGHGAGSACGKALGAVPSSTVGYELLSNPSIRASTSERRFVEHILDGQPEPPPYFARMKKQNKEGPPLLGALPRPRRLDAATLAEVAARGQAAHPDQPRKAPPGGKARRGQAARGSERGDLPLRGSGDRPPCPG